jgi:AGZA family xanthine/uracil permease-like MFS transporter
MLTCVLERLFRIRDAGSTPGREVLGGLTTFLTMAYIIFVNPGFLEAAKIPREGAIIATCLGSAFATLLMAFLANYPIALAPGMGMNAFFTYGICVGAGIPLQTALGLVFWSGVIFLALTFSGAREMIVRGVPPALKLSAAVGIGLFIAFIGLKQGGIIAGSPHTLVTLGDLGSVPALMTLAGLTVTLLLVAMKVPTAIFWGVSFTAAIGLAAGILQTPATWVQVPRVDLPGFEIRILDALQMRYVPLLLVLVFFDVFDNLGTLMGIAHQGGFLRNGELPRMGRVLAADAMGSLAGALIGTSTVTSYIESGTGVGVGARTGLANVVTGLLFIAALFVIPLASVVGGGIVWKGAAFNPVTAPALVVVGTLMVRAVKEIAWDDMTEAIPAFFTILLMPLTFNISHGLAVGVMVYVLVKAGARRWSEIHPLMWGLAAAFVLRYAFLPV